MSDNRMAELCIVENTNLETFSLVWLSSSEIDTKIEIEAQQNLRSMINHLKICKEIDECKQYIESLSKDDRTIVIIDNCEDQQLVPYIHHFQQVFSIYIHCTSKEQNKEWIKQHRKVNKFCLIFEEHKIILFC